MSSKLILPHAGMNVDQLQARAAKLDRIRADFQPAHPAFRFDPEIEWSVTDNMQVAFENGYLGEDVIKAKRLPLAIHYLLTGQVMPAIHLFFFGRPDEVIAEKFGWLDEGSKVITHG